MAALEWYQTEELFLLPDHVSKSFNVFSVTLDQTGGLLLKTGNNVTEKKITQLCLATSLKGDKHLLSGTRVAKVLLHQPRLKLGYKNARNTYLQRGKMALSP